MECVIKDVTIYYETIGEGKPVFMLHGFWVDNRIMKSCMEPVFEKRDGYKRIYFDLPGMGKTKGGDWIESTDQMIEVVLEFINFISQGSSCILVGFSYGGYLARGVVYRMPETVDGVFLDCPVGIAQRDKRTLPERVTIAREEIDFTGEDKNDIGEFLSGAVVASPATWKRYKDEIIEAEKIANDKFLERLVEKYSFSFNVDQLAKKYEKPALVLTGKQDSIVGYKDIMSFIENFSRCTFAILDRAGHNLHMEQEGLFKAMADEWLDRVEEYGRGIPPLPNT